MMLHNLLRAYSCKSRRTGKKRGHDDASIDSDGKASRRPAGSAGLNLLDREATTTTRGGPKLEVEVAQVVCGEPQLLTGMHARSQLEPADASHTSIED
mmetsp:Transcript_1038/g.3056  ORF Transcript_1038/g.3056 Transcript_1038/m.3056 type:complete len:98 (-) Transcript_1038:279-572(-)